jgi:hypothetical protein
MLLGRELWGPVSQRQGIYGKADAKSLTLQTDVGTIFGAVSLGRGQSKESDGIVDGYIHAALALETGYIGPRRAAEGGCGLQPNALRAIPFQGRLIASCTPSAGPYERQKTVGMTCGHLTNRHMHLVAISV